MITTATGKITKLTEYLNALLTVVSEHAEYDAQIPQILAERELVEYRADMNVLTLRKPVEMVLDEMEQILSYENL